MPDLWLEPLPPCPPCAAGRHDTCTDTLPLQAYFMPGYGLLACNCESDTCIARNILEASNVEL